MRQFFIKISLFYFLVLATILASLFFLPDPVSKFNLLGVLPDKHAKLTETVLPKIVFFGGSNLLMGIDSKQIAEAFSMPVINASFHGGLGLKYLLCDAEPFIKKGDVVILAPEYFYFFNSQYFKGDIELVSVIFDVFPEGKKYVSFDQWLHLTKYIPNYSVSKLKNNLLNLFLPNRNELETNNVYGRKSLNEYGDSNVHWDLTPVKFEPFVKCTGNEKVNSKVILFIQNFRDMVKSKGATLLILPPVLESQSYRNQKFIIDKIAASLKENGIPFIASPESYTFEYRYFFDTPYHCNGLGVKKRSESLVADLSQVVHRIKQ